MQIVSGRSLRVLDFDLENRPLSYWVPDRPTAEVTAIAWAFIDQPFDISCIVLTRDVDRPPYEDFVMAYNAADLVTGHYIRNHDLPILNAMLVECGLDPLKSKLTQDTKNDLIGWKDVPKSQEHLADMLGVASPKVQMSQAKWREANRLTPAGVEATRQRAMGDVRQHMEMRATLLKRGLLGPPKVWRP